MARERVLLRRDGTGRGKHLLTRRESDQTCCCAGESNIMAAIVESGRSDTIYTAICFASGRMMAGAFLLEYFATFMDLFVYILLSVRSRVSGIEMDEQSKLGRHLFPALGQGRRGRRVTHAGATRDSSCLENRLSGWNRPTSASHPATGWRKWPIFPL